MRLWRYGGVVAALSVALTATAAHAQVVTGPGIKLGERLVLHLGTGIEFRYDDNVFYVDRDKTGAFTFRLTPTLALATRPMSRDGQPHNIDFSLNLGVDYSEFLTADSQLARHRMVGVTAGAVLTLFSRSVFGADFYDNFARVSQTPYNLATTYNLNRDTNELGVRLHYRPGGQRLTVDLNYAFGVDLWEERVLKNFDLHYHRLALRANWKFFPKTALYLQAEYNPYVYFDPGPYLHPNSNAFRLTVGLLGLITPKLSTELYAGYGNPFYVSGPSPHTGVGGINFTWKPIAITALSLGYSHNFVNSLISSYYDSDQVFFSVAQALWRFNAVARLQYQNLRFHGILPSQGIEPMNATRMDHNIQFTFRIDFPIKGFMALSADYGLVWNSSNVQINYGALGLFPVGYLKNQVGLRFTINY